MIKKVLPLLIIFFPIAVPGQTVAIKDSFPSFALVELFTSEGCNSCPPADNLLKSLKADAEKNHKRVFFVAYHVDYWNKLGWKDPFSKNQFTYLQQNYSSLLEEKEMYTPQMIVNGKYSFVGSDAKKADDAIAKALNQKSFASVSLKKDSVVRDTLYLSYQSSIQGNDFSLKVLLLESGLKSEVTKGENKGKTLMHENVCRVYNSKNLRNKSGQVLLPVKNLLLNNNFSIIGFIQQKVTLIILGINSFGL